MGRKQPKTWGTKTLNYQSALDKVSVRRLLSYIKRQVKSAASLYAFEPIDQITIDQIKDVTNNILDSIKSRGGMVNHKVVCNKNKTLEHPINIEIYIKPTHAVNYVSMNVDLFGDSNILSRIVDLETTKFGFYPQTIPWTDHHHSYLVLGVVGLDSGFVCDPSIPDTSPFFVITNKDIPNYILCDYSYKYYAVRLDEADPQMDLTVGDMKLINSAINKYVETCD